MNNVGFMNESGFHEAGKNIDEAIAWYILAAENGNEIAIENLKRLKVEMPGIKKTEGRAQGFFLLNKTYRPIGRANQNKQPDSYKSPD
jgi:TPR repeat protein